MGADVPAPASGGGSSEKPFDDEPFDAGVEADEKSDPKTYIEQLTGKLGQSLRQYTETQGQPDFELEKFAINSLLSATHTAQMSDEDQSDIIKKVETSGESEGEEQPEGEEPEATQEPTASVGGAEPAGATGGAPDAGGAAEAGGGAAPMNEMSLGDHNTQKLVAIYDNGDDRTKQILSRLVSYTDVPNREQFLQDLQDEIDYSDLREIFEALKQFKINTEPAAEPVAEDLYEEETIFLNDPKKNNMFQPGSNDILKQNSCKKGFKHLGFDENNEPNCVQIHENSSSFVNKNKIRSILQESLNQDDMSTQPITKPKPVVKPAKVEPSKPSRRDKPFKPSVAPGIRPDPKANLKEAGSDYETYHKTFSSAVQAAGEYAQKRGYVVDENDWWTKVATGPKKPSDGKTNRYSIVLLKDGQESKKMLHMQVFNMGDGFNKPYELNAYIQ